MTRRNPTIKAPLEHTGSSRNGRTVLAVICNMALAVLIVAVLFPGGARAASRYALDSASISSGVATGVSSVRRPDSIGRMETATLGPGYALQGVFLAASDMIFTDGFEPTAVYNRTFAANVPIGSGVVLLGSVNVPAGSYVAFVRLQAQTGSEASPGNSYRFDCTLSPGFDSAVYRVGQESYVERYLTFQGAATLSNAGAIQFYCHDGNGHTDTELSGKLTIMSVGTIN